jgi:hypothetical protein
MTSTTLTHAIEIDAPADAVWAVLADTDAYPEWNPFVLRLAGDLRDGARLEARIAPPGGRTMTFKPTVLAARAGSELRWLGRFLVPGLLDGEHSFRIEPLADGRTRFVQTERFTGVLVGLVRNALAKTQLGFEQMNDALKLRVEGKR